MIIYNNIDLEEIAPVMIEDIRVSPIQYSAVTRPRAIAGGSEFVRMRHGTRTVAVTFAILQEDRDTRQKTLAELSAWAKTDAEYPLVLPHYADRYLKAVCTARPEPSYRQWWESKLRLVFTCYSDPYWNAMEEITANCGFHFTVGGDAPPLMRIERRLTAAESLVRFDNGSETMVFSEIPAGNLAIDLNRQTAEVNGASVMQYYRPSSRFLIPRTGTQRISGEGTVIIQERWQ